MGVKGLGSSEGTGGKIESSRWDFIRTDHQLKPHEGYAPGAIHLRSEGEFGAGREAGRTMQMAKPQWWHAEAACAQDPEHIDLFDKCPNSWGKHTDVIEAQRAVCAGCPVREECLEDALSEEGTLTTKNRYLMRGGMTPKDRYRWVRDHGPEIRETSGPAA